MVTALLRSISWFACLWPESIVRAVARVSGAFWWYVLRYRRAVIEENLARAFPEKSLGERRVLGRRACVHLAHALFDLFRIPRHRRREYRGAVRVEGLDHFNAAKREGKGVLCLTGHLGSFELSVAGCAKAVHPASLVVKSFPPGVDRFINALRESAGLGVIHAENALKPMLRALAANEAVAFVLDQNATRKIGVFVDFFGVPACTMSALALIAARTGAPVVGVTIFRDTDHVNVLRIEPAIPLELKATRDETVAHMTQVYTRFIEQAIRNHPEQWLWTHKRWRTRPKAPEAAPAPAAGAQAATERVEADHRDGD